MARVLVLDGHGSAALAFVRSLGRARHWTAVGFSQGLFAPATLSRYCRLCFEYPNPVQGIGQFIESVKHFCQERGIDLVLPMTDATLWPLVRHRPVFEGLTRIAGPNCRALEVVSDKFRSVSLARQVGVPAPETLLIRSIGDLDITRGWSFPVVVKDRFSVRWVGDRGVAGGVSYAYSYDDLLRQMQKRLESAGDVMAQEFISGAGVGFSCFALEGSACLPFQWRRLREKDPRGSGSSARISAPLDPEVFRLAQGLIGKTEFTGLAMVEFKQKISDGRLVLMEVNGRPWGSIQLPIHCGIDYPLHLLHWYIDGHPPPRRIDYKDGVTCRWLAADLVHLENLWGGEPAGWPVPYPNFWTSLLKISVPWYPGLRYDDISLSDPRPGLAEVGSWIRAHLGGRTS